MCIRDRRETVPRGRERSDAPDCGVLRVVGGTAPPRVELPFTRRIHLHDPSTRQRPASGCDWGVGGFASVRSAARPAGRLPRHAARCAPLRARWRLLDRRRSRRGGREADRSEVAGRRRRWVGVEGGSCLGARGRANVTVGHRQSKGKGRGELAAQSALVWGSWVYAFLLGVLSRNRIGHIRELRMRNR